MSSHDRRSFFKAFLRDAASAAYEVREALRPDEPKEPEPLEPTFELPPPQRALPAKELLSEERLLELCRELGLEARVDDVRRLARTSVRLTRATSPVRSRIGGVADLPPDFVWPTFDGRELAFVGQLGLDEIAAAGHGDALPLPAEGLLLFFYDLATLPSGLLPSHRGTVHVELVDGASVERDTTRLPALRPLPVQPSFELMVPPAWSFQAEPLELSPDETEPWDELRVRVAEAQGVELEDKSPDWFSLHRLLGYHDELGREPEVECELASSGIVADDYDEYFAHRDERSASAREWRLLLQLSTDEDLQTPWDAFGRLYVFVRDADLRARRFDGAWAILR